jgi:Leucine-rich repeat (LRR) protein
MNHDWWNQLEPQWKQAFSSNFFANNQEPTEDELALISTINTFRFAGPTAPFPNINFELTNLTGISKLVNTEILIITHHQIETIKELVSLTKLKSLFLLNNKIKSLQGIESITGLEQLYVQCNNISSIKEISKLVNLKEVYINDNQISSLDGLTDAHSDKLTVFFCRPNEHLKQKEILRVEREIGIICRG